MMTNAQRAELLRTLSGVTRVMLTSRGCGTGSKLAYRVVDPSNRNVVGLFDKTGRWCDGDPITDEMLLTHARQVIDSLQQYTENTS